MLIFDLPCVKAYLIALESGMQQEEMQPLVDAWREASPNNVRLWHDVGCTATKAVRDRMEAKTRHTVLRSPAAT